MLDMDGKRVLITGATGGVGRALVETFAALGARIVAYDRDAAALDRLGIAETAAFDLVDRAALGAAVARTLASGPPDVVVGNAGWTRAETMAELDDDSFGHEMEVNLSSGALLTRELLPAMRGRGGAFVFVSSCNAHAHYGNPAYSAAKAGLLAWMRAIAVEEGRHGIRANAVAPGSIMTAAWDHRFEKFPGLDVRLKKLYPLGRLVQPLEVARAVAFLASPMASGITGVTLNVDAGLGAGNLPFLDIIAPRESV